LNLAAMRTYVRARLTIHSTDSTTITQIDQALNDARDRLVADEELTIAQADLTFTANFETVSLPAGVMKVLSVSTSEYVLTPVTRQELAFYRLRDSSTGPLAYVVDGASTTLKVWPEPTVTEVVVNALEYVPELALMDDDADTPSEIPRAFHSMLCELAIMRIASSEEAPELANDARRMVYGTPGTSERGMLEEFRTFLRKRQGSGDTRIWPKNFA
jgi:hypothetical protein